MLWPIQIDLKCCKTHLSHGELCQELCILVCGPEVELVVHLDLGAGVGGRDQGLLGAEVVRVGVQGLKQEMKLVYRVWTREIISLQGLKQEVK